VRVDGRSGIAGAEEEVDNEVVCEFDCEFPVEIALEEERAELAPAAPPLSHGFGGDTVAILPNARMLSASKGFD
jgi:hypothetical protein